MKRHKCRKGAYMLAVVLALLATFVIIELLIVKFNGQTVPVPIIDRQQTLGAGKQLTYVILGDSTAVGQGAIYKNGIAVQTAEHIASKGYTVRLNNYGVSGARMNDVVVKQLPLVQQTPDVVLLSISANDVTHLSKISSVERDMKVTIDTLRNKNPGVKIVITGTPAMGSIPRFPQPLRALAGQRTNNQNAMFEQLATDKRVVLAPIAKKLGPTFAENPQLFAQDKFHPNDEGYALWTSVIIEAIDKELL